MKQLKENDQTFREVFEGLSLGGEYFVPYSKLTIHFYH